MKTMRAQYVASCVTWVLATLAAAGEAPKKSAPTPPSAATATVTDNDSAASASDRQQANGAEGAETEDMPIPMSEDGSDAAGSGFGWGESADATCGDDRWWFAADYVLLWTNGNPVPALVTTNAAVPPRPQAGVIGVGDTEILLGDDKLDREARSGMALTVGRWLDDDQDWGLQVSGFLADNPSDELHGVWQSPGVPVLARPFLNAATGLEDSQLVAYPDVVEGLAKADTNSDLQSVEALLRANWREGTRGRIDVVGGYRYLRFREGLRLEEHLVLRDPGGLAPIGTTIDLFDQFDTRNEFHGGELGLLTTFYRGPLALDIATKLGLGNLSREVAIDGSTLVRTPRGGQATSAGGLLALPSNMGVYQDDAFALLPELDLKASVQLTQHISLSVGYNLLFLTNVYRTGGQIDRCIDASQLPAALPANDLTAAGLTHPAPLLSSSTLRAQGLTVGATLNY